jgi:C1A family cysteine protease
MKFNIFVLFFLLFPLISFSQGPCEIVHREGIVPCRLTECTLCDFFVMLDRIVNYILFCLIPPLAIFMIVLAGLLYVGAVFEFLPGGFETVSRAKRIFFSVLIGLFIAYCAWLIINLFLLAIGYRNRNNWWQIQCSLGPQPQVATQNLIQPPQNNLPAIQSPIPQNQSLNINVNQTLSNDGDILNLSGSIFPSFPFSFIEKAFAQENLSSLLNQPIFSLSASGYVTLNSRLSFARIILEDKDGKEYLVFEAQGPYDQGTINFDNLCSETCALNSIFIKRVRAEIENATLHISTLHLLTPKEKDKSDAFLKIQAFGIENYQREVLKNIEERMVQKINNYNKANNLRWTAGKTGVSGYTYSQKKMLLGAKRLPNLAGFEYYKGGIFEIEPPKPKTQPKSQTTSNFPPSFDWRNRHGKNWMTPAKDQGLCGSCWAFATVGAIEAVTNLYYNQLLNLDLSEQHLISCAASRGCCGVYISQAKNFFEGEGLVTEECFPYQDKHISFSVVDYCGMPPGFSKETPCWEKCVDWNKFLVKSKSQGIFMKNAPLEEVKKFLIKHGPLAISVSSAIFDPYPHAMVLVGYDTDLGGGTIFILKNSWGKDWGEGGYGKIDFSDELVLPYGTLEEMYAVGIPIEVSFMPDLKINCEDRDNDGYCNWGISEQKPDTCPAFCKPEKDCDDSNPNLGPFDENYNCREISPLGKDSLPPQIGESIVIQDLIGRDIRIEAWVFDNVEVTNCILSTVKDNGERKDFTMQLSSIPCKSCRALIGGFIGGDSLYRLAPFKAQVKCRDRAGNLGEGKIVEVTLITPSSEDKSPPVVGKINPTIANTGIKETFFVNVNDDTGIEECNFYVNGELIGQMEISPLKCLSGKAYIDYTFSIPGTFTVYAECKDISGKIAKGESTNIEVSSLPCQSLTFPKDYWQRIWYEGQLQNCLGEGFFEPNIQFDNNWGSGVIAFGKLDKISFISGRTIDFESGRYSFSIGSDDGVKVFIDGTSYLDKWKDRSYKVDTFEVDLSGGPHQIEIHYYENKGAARLSFNFEKISQVISTPTPTPTKTPTPTQTPTPTPTKSPSPSCINECSYLDQKEYRCSGNILQKRVCGNFDSDSCLEWSDWFEEKNCDSMDKCIDTTYYDYFCSQNNCTFNSYPNDPRCTQQPSWVPCDPTSGWQCGESKGGSEPYCSGTPIGWGRGSEGIVYCEEDKVAIEGKCEGKNDDKVVKSEEVLHLFPYPSVLTQSEVKFKPKGGWYCKFKCSGFLCGSDGCGWVKCQKTQKDIEKIELKIFDWLGKMFGQPLYQTTVYQQNEVVWNGTNNKGEKLPNGTYYFEAKIYLKDQRVFTNEGEIQIKR